MNPVVGCRCFPPEYKIGQRKTRHWTKLIGGALCRYWRVLHVVGCVTWFPVFSGDRQDRKRNRFSQRASRLTLIALRSLWKPILSKLHFAFRQSCSVWTKTTTNFSSEVSMKPSPTVLVSMYLCYDRRPDSHLNSTGQKSSVSYQSWSSEHAENFTTDKKLAKADDSFASHAH